ncbi:hypothetical protein [Bradyrhizobium guangzhouense]|uniref:hypothetical protein n=1 Tax=Bradyrhizobium guangzhouense TaxID=1325095 RepID=UPI0019D6CB7B|nr:hypothetical protein [Bradyrhizobium guangzhouense]
MNWQDAKSNMTKHPFRGGGSLPFNRPQARKRRRRHAHRFSITRLYRAKGVIARLDRAIQYAETAAIEPRGRGVLDAPLSRSMTTRMTRERRAAHRFSITRLDRTKGVIARLDRAIQYAETAAIEASGRRVLDAPLSRSMTARMTRECRAAHRFSITRLDRTKGVIARLDRAIQYAETAAIEPGAAAYWMPRFRGA